MYSRALFFSFHSSINLILMQMYLCPFFENGMEECCSGLLTSSVSLLSFFLSLTHLRVSLLSFFKSSVCTYINLYEKIKWHKPTYSIYGNATHICIFV
jgi:hypothetical protein